MNPRAERPLDGTTVLDLSRMLPGAVTVRKLADLGARVIKVEAPQVGDPLRWVPSAAGSAGSGFRALYRGTESICLDLRQPAGAAALRSLAGHVDVLLESFRPGKLAAWGLDPERLLAAHPALTICSLSSYGSAGSAAQRVAHDINVVAESGLLSLLPGEGLPRVQLADVTAGLLATSAILAALLGRTRSGRGGWIDLPLSGGTLPFLTVPFAEQAAGGGGLTDALLGGAAAAYRLYRCAGGKRIAVAALEPKFWAAFVDLLGLPELTEDGLDPGDRGRLAAERVQQELAALPREHWLALFEQRGLPVTPVLELEEAAHARPDAATDERAPELGEHTATVLAEFKKKGSVS